MDQHADLTARHGDDDGAETSLRRVLQAATRDVHERLHRHAGFAAIQDGTIGRAAYRDLVVRLYGFYAAFKVAAAVGPVRSAWLASDLEALGLARPLETLPRCRHVPRLDTAHRRLGALYVAEGSALGGRELARGLDRLLGADATAGRRFFIGRGPRTGAAWRGYLARLSAAPREASAHAEIVAGAVETFAAFERWLDGWRTSSGD